MEKKLIAIGLLCSMFGSGFGGVSVSKSEVATERTELEISDSSKYSVIRLAAYDTNGNSVAMDDCSTVEFTKSPSELGEFTSKVYPDPDSDPMHKNKCYIHLSPGVKPGKVTVSAKINNEALDGELKEVYVDIIGEEQPVISIKGQKDGAEPNSNGLFTVYSSKRLDKDLSVNINIDETINNTATNGDDYEAINSPVIIRAGYDKADVEVKVKSDQISEGDEYLKIDVVGGDYLVDSDESSAQITIRDNTVHKPEIGIVKIQNPAEPSTNGQFEIHAAEAVSDDITVRVNLNGSTAEENKDFNAITKEVVIRKGQASVIKDITVIDDNIYDPNESIKINLESSSDYQIKVGEESATLVIQDDDPQLSGQPSIPSPVKVDQEISISQGTLNFPLEASLGYSWQACPTAGGQCSDIATGQLYKVQSADADWKSNKLQATVTKDGQNFVSNQASVEALPESGPLRLRFECRQYSPGLFDLAVQIHVIASNPNNFPVSVNINGNHPGVKTIAPNTSEVDIGSAEHTSQITMKVDGYNGSTTGDQPQNCKTALGFTGFNYETSVDAQRVN
ncbi:Calx-beta domain-containing protein [Cysteiniphilum litorale]|uniref:Calx-beta domain-containing protein n=4 Tax=Cysteiniphilum TaxID=2056696 RepID=A0A8J2Z5P5_9GAMM|nr:Calx-beta domain-containing protein [Cysteiniphilum litorale]GGG03623.1 hypothetical protein GCM10010995_21330 [Cysteiniphilum litorale]